MTMKFYVRTLGCQMNESDSERVAGILSQAGAEKADQFEEADFIVVNTCAVRKKSEEKLYSYLGRLAALKKKRPVKIAVIGCVAQLRGPELVEKKLAVDYVFGPDNYDQLFDLVHEENRKKVVLTSWSKEWKEEFPGPVIRESPVSAYVPIMEGCNNFCAYCIVPYTRGREKYRPLRFIQEEVSRLAELGYKEIQLLGQNVNTYRDPESGKEFVDLLQEIARPAKIPWVRFLTSHPKNFTPALAETMAAHRSICRQLHLPLQSGSSAILKRMKRGYSRDDYLELVFLLRRLMPEIHLSTDIIVGFPGETEKDFEETLDLLRTVRFSNIFSFRYSPRPLTEASRLEDDIPLTEKTRRLKEVQRLQRHIQLEDHGRQVGSVMSVLCVGKAPRTPHLYTGRNEAFQVVNFHSAEDCRGDFVEVRVTGFGPYSLQGERLTRK